MTHFGMGLLSATVSYVAFVFRPDLSVGRILTIALGYASLAFIAMTLLIGPINLLRRRGNPVNIYLRRDTGIWAGVTGLLHVVFGLQIHMDGQLVRYFFVWTDQHRLAPLLDLFGLSNYLGLSATGILILLLVLSNDLSLRLLRAPLWKRLQRFNYLLVLLVIAHTAGYQVLLNRSLVVTLLTGALAAGVLGAQAMGVCMFCLRRRRSREGYAAETPDAKVATVRIPSSPPTRIG